MRPGLMGNGDAPLERYKTIVFAGQHHLEPTHAAQRVTQFARESQHQVLFAFAPTLGARVDAPMARVQHHNHRPIAQHGGWIGGGGGAVGQVKRRVTQHARIC